MRKSVITTALVFTGLVTASAQKQGEGTFSPPTKSGDETITVRWKDAEGKNKDQSVTTGEPGTEHTDDDLTPDMTAKDKAKRIKQALDGIPGLEVSLNADGDGVVVKAPGGEIKGFKVTNNTGEKKNKSKVVKPKKEKNATVAITGNLIGVDGLGEAAELTVGADELSVTLKTAQYASAAELMVAMYVELVAIGFEVALISDATLVMDLPEEAMLTYGCSDLGLVQTASVDLVEDDVPAAGDDTSTSD